MKARAFFGIDLGTTQCSVAYVLDSPRLRDQKVVDPQLVRLGGEHGFGGFRSDTMQSIVGVDWTDRRSSKLLFGAEFFRTFERKKRDATLLRRGRDFFTSVKSEMGTNRIYPFSKIPGIQSPVQATTALLEHIAILTRESNPDLDITKSRVVITVPASFSALAREDTLQAARRTGRFPQLVDPRSRVNCVGFATITLLGRYDGGVVRWPEDCTAESVRSSGRPARITS